MSEFVSVTIAGQRFSLTKEEAGFLAEHLKTAVVNPNASLSFVRRGNGSGEGVFSIERSAQMVRAHSAAEVSAGGMPGAPSSAADDAQLTDC